MVFGWIVVSVVMVSLMAMLVDMLLRDSRPCELKLDKWERLANQVEIDAYEHAKWREELKARTVYYTI